MTSETATEVAIVGSGIAGIATAYYLCTEQRKTSVLLVDSRQPMSYTSAQSGDNYRDWWPHPAMVAFTRDSIERMHRIRRDADNVFNMTDRGYVLATRREAIDDLVAGLHADADITSGSANVQRRYPALGAKFAHVIHISRAGDFSSQQLAAFMLERIRAAGGRRLAGEVVGIAGNGVFTLQVDTTDGRQAVKADSVVNAAGPFAGRVSAMFGVDLPVSNLFQQKIAFDDTLGAISRTMPFTIDLDDRPLDWSEEEREMLEDDPDLSWLVERLPGGVHCRPEGGGKGSWVKLGWAYNNKSSEPQEDLANEPCLDRSFAEIVIRRAAALIPALRPYIETPPARRSHYGGYYTMTDENWPLIGPLGPEGSFIVGALSGFGSMAACAAGATCAAWVAGSKLPDYARDLSFARYDDAGLMSQITGTANRGVL